MIAALLLAALALTPSVHHAVSTANVSAQAAFDRGLLLYYAYNGDAAYDAFAGALKLDPHLAMAAWGQAVAAGSDLNTGITEERFARAHEAAERAVALEQYASAQDRAYIDALAARYGGTWETYGAGDDRYIAAMEHLIVTYPGDDDARMLLAEALMEKNISDEQARDQISIVLDHNPRHIMANHLCVHSYDFSQDHSPALPCADRLNALSYDVAEVHLAHMPAHTYTVLGRYAEALAASERAWQLRERSDTPLKYERHDAYTGFSVAMMGGDLHAALLWAQRIGAAYGGSDAWAAFARFGSWDRLNGDAPRGEFYGVLATGLAALHRGDIATARRMLSLYGAADSDYRWLLEASIDDATGDVEKSAAAFERAIAFQAHEDAGEQIPLFPAGEYFGAMYLRHGLYAQAAATYQATLQRYPNDPRALYGLAAAQRALGNAGAAAQAMKSFSAVWGDNAPPALSWAKVSP